MPDATTSNASAARRVRVVIYHERRLVREGVAEALADHGDVAVVALADDSDDLADLVESYRPDVVVASTPGGHDIGPRVVLLTDDLTLDRVVEQVRVQASVGDTGSATQSISDNPRSRLTAREVEVLQQLARGKTGVEAAAALGIGRKTLENYKQRIYAKLDVQSQAHAVAVGLRDGVITSSSVSEGSVR